MKLSKFKLAATFLLPAALMFTSCSGENEDPTTNNNGSSIELAPITIAADLLQPVSKVGFASGRYEDGDYEADAVVWEVGDDISVNFVQGEVSELQTFKVTAVGGGIATLSGKGPRSGNYDVYAVYPAIPKSTSATALQNLPVTIANEQAQVGNELTINNNALIWGEKKNVNFDNPNFSLEFLPKTALLRFNIMNLLDENITITKVEFEYDGESNLNTISSLNMNTGSLSGTSTPKAYSVEITGGSSVAKDATFDAYMAILPTASVSDGNYKVTVTINAGDENTRPFTITLDASDVGNGAFSVGNRYVFELDIDDSSNGFVASEAVSPLPDVYTRGIYTLDGVEHDVLRVHVAETNTYSYLSNYVAGIGTNNPTSSNIRYLEDSDVPHVLTYAEAQKCCVAPWRAMRLGDADQGLDVSAATPTALAAYTDPYSQFRTMINSSGDLLVTGIYVRNMVGTANSGSRVYLYFPGWVTNGSSTSGISVANMGRYYLVRCALDVD